MRKRCHDDQAELQTVIKTLSSLEEKCLRPVPTPASFLEPTIPP